MTVEEQIMREREAFAAHMRALITEFAKQERHAYRVHTESKKAAAKTRRRKTQLRMYQEKLELMKTWGGILRTICQKFRVWK